MPFKGISYLDIWKPFGSAECNYLCNFGRGYYKEQFCEINLNLGKWSRRCCLKIYFLELKRPSFIVEWNHLCNFERAHHGEHSCAVIRKFESVVQEKMSFKDISYLELW